MRRVPYSGCASRTSTTASRFAARSLEYGRPSFLTRSRSPASPCSRYDLTQTWSVETGTPNVRLTVAIVAPWSTISCTARRRTSSLYGPPHREGFPGAMRPPAGEGFVSFFFAITRLPSSLSATVREAGARYF